MDLSEISHLISIRNFLIQSLEDHGIDKATSRELGKMLFSVNKKIAALILDDKFKKYIGYDGGLQAQEARQVASAVFIQANKIKAGESGFGK